MSMPNPARKYTVDEYLEFERNAEERHEYLDGEIFAMAGESGAHADISVNLVGLFVMQLKGTPCRVRTKDTKVRSGPTPRLHNKTSGLYSYPDLVVIYGKVEDHDEHRDVILNPKVIIEVLSPSTMRFDRGEKFARLQAWNPTLTDYLLVSQDQSQIEHFSRKPEGGWPCTVYSGLESTVDLPTIGCKLKLADVYDRVDFQTST